MTFVSDLLDFAGEVGGDVKSLHAEVDAVAESVSGFHVALDDVEVGAVGASVTAQTGAAALGQSGTVIITEGPSTRDSGGITSGFSVVIPRAQALQLDGRRVRISVLARQPSTNAATRFGVAYSTSDNGNSGYLQADGDLTPGWKWFTFYYDVPLPVSGGADYIGIFGDDAQSGKATEVARIVIAAEGSLSLNYSSRALLAFLWPSYSAQTPTGAVVSDGAVEYLKMPAGHALFGTDPIADLPGLVPFGDWSPLHFAGVSPGGNMSAALVAAIEGAFAAGVDGVALPAGRYLLNSRADIDLGPDGSPVSRLSIKGNGCQLVVPSSNQSGGIQITKNNNFQQIDVSGITIYSDVAIGSHGSVTNGTALKITSTLDAGDPGWGATGSPEVKLENVLCLSTNPALTGRWDSGIVLEGCWFPEVTNCYVATRHPDNDTSTNSETGDGILFLNCFQPKLLNSKASGRFLHGIRIDEDEGFGYEDFQVTGCYSEGAIGALTIQMSSAAEIAEPLKEPGGRISGGHFNGHRWAIKVANRRQFTIAAPLLYTTIGSPGGFHEYTDSAFLWLENCKDALVSVHCPEGGHYNSTSDTSRGVHLEGVCDDITISGSQFGNRGVGIFNNSTGTRIKVFNNRYTGTNTTGVTGPTVKLHDPSNLIKGFDAAFTDFGVGFETVELADLNDSRANENWKISGANAATGNAPTSHPYYGHTLVFDANSAFQFAARAGVTSVDDVYMRQKQGGTWRPWYRVANQDNFNTVLQGAGGVSGSFTTTDGKTITISDGIVTAIV